MFPRNKAGTRVHSDVPPERKAERGYIRMFPRNETGTRAHPPKPPFWKTTLLSPSDLLTPETWTNWEPVDPVVADPVRQDNEKRNNIQIYTKIHYFKVHRGRGQNYIRKSLILKYTEGGDNKTSQYSYLVVILSHWVPVAEQNGTPQTVTGKSPVTSSFSDKQPR